MSTWTNWEELMLACTDTITPDTNPRHHIVGRRFRAWDGRTYICAWYNHRAGYQMHSDDNGPPRSTNVSERAIGRTFHLVEARAESCP